MTIDEVVTLVRIGLRDASLSACDRGDLNHDGEISIDKIITAVSFALAGCR